jgi:hypothetical protein
MRCDTVGLNVKLISATGLNPMGWDIRSIGAHAWKEILL